MPAPTTTVWLSFTVEGETFEVQFPTQWSDERMAFLDARDQLRLMLERAADQCTATHYQH